MSDTIPGCDANEAYEIVSHRPAFLGDFWTVICNGITVRHYPAKSKALAERYIRDPDYRQSLIEKKLWERGIPPSHRR
jgi:hypothetical protein